MTKKIDDYRTLPGFETKRMPTFIKQIDEDKGIVEHFVAIMGNLDAGSDVIELGAFRKSLAERKNRIRVLDQHQTDSVLRVIGKPLDIREVGRDELTPEVLEYAPDATGGLLATTQYAINTDNGRNAYELVKGRFVDESSIGYDAVQVHYEDVVIDEKKITTRHLKEIRLWEYSNVIFGMNPATAVVSAKEAGSEEETNPLPAETAADQKATTPFQDLDLAQRARRWDGDAAEGRVRAWAGGEDDMDWEKYRDAFLWYDAEDAELLGSYKLGYADIVEGDLVAVPRAIFAAAGSLQGSRGQTPDIPEADAERVKAQIERYYAKMRAEFEDDSLIAPWNKAGEGAAEPGTITSIDFNVPAGFDLDMDEFNLDAFNIILTAALQAAGLTIKAQKGRNLARLLNDRIDELVTDDRSRSDIVAEMGRAAGITAGTVNQILGGDIDCPTERRRRGFAEVLDIPISRINSALEEDGCTLEENAGDDPAQAKAESDETKGHGYGGKLGDILQGNLHYVFTCLSDKWYINGAMNREERILLSSLIGDALDVLHQGMPEDLAERDINGPLMVDPYGYDYYSLSPDIDAKTNAKAGRVLSARNAQKIQAALAQLHEILMEAGLLGDAAEEANAQHEDEEDEDKRKQVQATDAPTADNTANLLQLLEVEVQEANTLRLF